MDVIRGKVCSGDHGVLRLRHGAPSLRMTKRGASRLTVDDNGWAEVESQLGMRNEEVGIKDDFCSGGNLSAKRISFVVKVIVVVLAVIGILFTAQLVGRAMEHHAAIVDIKNGRYEDALVHLCRAEGYRDSEELEEFCNIMLDYDPVSEASVHRCYHALDDLTFDNAALRVEFAKVTTEIGTLYKFGGSK